MTDGPKNEGDITPEVGVPSPQGDGIVREGPTSPEVAANIARESIDSTLGVPPAPEAPAPIAEAKAEAKERDFNGELQAIEKERQVRFDLLRQIAAQMRFKGMKISDELLTRMETKNANIGIEQDAKKAVVEKAKKLFMQVKLMRLKLRLIKIKNLWQKQKRRKSQLKRKLL